MSQKNRVGLIYVLYGAKVIRDFKQKIKLFAKKREKMLGKI